MQKFKRSAILIKIFQNTILLSYGSTFNINYMLFLLPFILFLTTSKLPSSLYSLVNSPSVSWGQILLYRLLFCLIPVKPYWNATEPFSLKYIQDHYSHCKEQSVLSPDYNSSSHHYSVSFL